MSNLLSEVQVCIFLEQTQLAAQSAWVVEYQERVLVVKRDPSSCVLEVNILCSSTKQFFPFTL